MSDNINFDENTAQERINAYKYALVISLRSAVRESFSTFPTVNQWLEFHSINIRTINKFLNGDATKVTMDAIIKIIYATGLQLETRIVGQILTPMDFKSIRDDLNRTIDQEYWAEHTKQIIERNKGENNDDDD